MHDEEERIGAGERTEARRGMKSTCLDTPNARRRGGDRAWIHPMHVDKRQRDDHAVTVTVTQVDHAVTVTVTQVAAARSQHHQWSSGYIQGPRRCSLAPTITSGPLGTSRDPDLLCLSVVVVIAHPLSRRSSISIVHAHAHHRPG